MRKLISLENYHFYKVFRYSIALCAEALRISATIPAIADNYCDEGETTAFYFRENQLFVQKVLIKAMKLKTTIQLLNYTRKYMRKISRHPNSRAKPFCHQSHLGLHQVLDQIRMYMLIKLNSTVLSPHMETRYTCS